MKALLYTFSLVFLAITSCKKDKESKYLSFDEIPSNKYYSSEILTAPHTKAYGNWIVYGTSGGFTGQGYTQNFQKFLFKSNGIFGIVRNDSLITYGKIVIKNQNAQELLVEFVASNNNQEFEILVDNEKYIQLRSNDSLDLVAPCCDRYTTYLRRE